jgi:putative transposase
MPQSLANVLVHLIFSTKDRELFLQGDLAKESHKILAEISNRLECPAIEVGGVEDHVHIVGQLSRKICLADWVKELKRASTIELKNHAELTEFHWQAGYGAFSVSQSNLEDVRRYIVDQREHHRRYTFQEEFRLFLKRHSLDCDEHGRRNSYVTPSG